MSLKDLPSDDGQVQQKKDPFEVHHLFTTPVFYVDKILNHDKVQKELDNCIDDIEWNLMEAWGNAAAFEHSMRILYLSELADL